MSQVRCRKCADIIESLYHHDFKKCKCGETFIDGGNDYIRTNEDGEILD